jgi:D-alanyl-D-alanine dipeptidase
LNDLYFVSVVLGEAVMEAHDLVDILAINPRIVVDLKYSTTDNFTGQVVYKFQTCLLKKQAALNVSRAQEELEKKGLGLKVWDGYRPIAAQWIFWNLIQDERYVADPRKGGRHTRGTAVDLTIIDKEGRELIMPTGFDDFSEQAHLDYMDLSKEQIKNRALLIDLMDRHGFSSLPTEWWHYDLKGWEQHPPLEYNP